LLIEIFNPAEAVDVLKLLSDALVAVTVQVPKVLPVTTPVTASMEQTEVVLVVYV
jgi:hypothetical protein